MTGYVRVAAHIAGRAIVDPTTGAPTADHLRQLNDNLRNIRVAIDQLATQADDIEASLLQAGIALTTAQEARDKANTVEANLDAKKADDALLNSYTSPVNILSATDAGDGTATVTVAEHSRIYGDGTSVAVAAGSITGLPLNAFFYVVYSDVERTGGSVAFSALTDPSQAGQSQGQHLCGDIATPAAGGADSGGGGMTPRGVRYNPELQQQ